MRSHCVSVALTAFALSLAADALPQGSDHHVVLVSLDGFAASRLETDELRLPNLRALARDGVWPESSETVFPSTDHPAHTSILTGVEPRKHGVIGNYMLNRVTGEYFRVTNLPRSESIKVPTLFDAAKTKGLRTASFLWPETRDDPSIDHNIPLVYTGDAKIDAAAADPDFLQELRDAGVPIDLFYAWYNDLPLQVSSDRILTRAAVHVIETYQPHLLAIRLPALDRYQHEFGPEHYLSKAAFTAADYNVGLLRDAVERAGLSKSTTFVIVSDHGFHTIEHSVNVYPLFAQARLTEEVNLYPYFLSVAVELTDAFDPRKHQDELLRVIDRAVELPGISQVIFPDGLHAMGLPRYEEDPHMLGHYIIVGDSETRLVIDEEGESTRRSPLSAPIHSHGYLAGDRHTDPVMVLSGRGIRTGFRPGHVSNYDIAPTVGALLELEMDGLRGRVLDEAFVASR